MKYLNNTAITQSINQSINMKIKKKERGKNSHASREILLGGHTTFV